MKNYRFLLISDALFCALTSLFFAKALTAFFIKSNAAAWAVSLLISATAATAFIFFKLRKNRMLLLKESDRFYISNVAKEFEIMPDNRLIDWFFTLFTKLKRNPVKADDRIFLNENITVFFDFSEKFTREKLTAVLKKINFLSERFSEDDIKQKTDSFNQRQKNECPKIIIFCNQPSVEARKLADETAVGSGCEIYLTETEFLFSLMKKADCFYNPKIIAFKTKKSFSAKIKEECIRNFTKKRALTFLLLGLVTLIFSSFTFFKKYYLFYSLICFSFALICLIFGKNSLQNGGTPPL